MNNEKYNQIIDEAYDNYLKNFVTPICHPNLDVQPDYYMPMTQEWFVNSAKERGLRGEEFSQIWGLRIEERELSLEERTKILVSQSDNKRDFYDRNYKLIIEEKSVLDLSNIPTRLIKITYNNETIEVYE